MKANHTPEDARRMMKATAKRMGFRVTPNSRGDWLCYQGKRFRGIIVIIESSYSLGMPFAVCTYHNNCADLDDVRHAMNTTLADAGIVKYAK